MRRSDHPSRPSAITCCRFSALKTLPIPAAGVQPTAQVNVSAPGAALAGFQVSINGRFWVSTEDLLGRASAANILGITVRELDKLVDIYELSEKLKNVREPGASITWAREIKNLNRNLLTPTILDTIIRKINESEITNSKDVRKLRVIL